MLHTLKVDNFWKWLNRTEANAHEKLIRGYSLKSKPLLVEAVNTFRKALSEALNFPQQMFSIYVGDATLMYSLKE